MRAMTQAATPVSVLLVEDDARFRDAFTRAIEQAPTLRLAGAAANASQGLALLRTARPDVLLIDLDLPDFPGVELIRHAAKHLPDCDVMVITVFGDERHVIESLEAGATGYLLKDSLPADFVEQIHVLRAGGSPISPTIARQLLTRFQSSARPEPPAPEGETRLSEREASVLNLVSKGYTHAEIATLLGVSPHTVLTYVKRIYQKLQVSSKAEALHEARTRGLMKD
jgi:DNA-binding NarL/FixJ family response regulator